MVLKYNVYLKLMDALEEYAKKNKVSYPHTFEERQNAIYWHYIGSHSSFVAESESGERMLFPVEGMSTKNDRKAFRRFMRGVKYINYANRNQSKNSKKDRQQSQENN